MSQEITHLVVQAQHHKQEAWEQLYNETVKEIYFLAAKTVGKNEAEDLVQDTYLTAYNKLHTLEDPQKFRSWLCMIAANRCRDYLKKRKASLFTDLESDEGVPLDWADDREDTMPEKQLDHEETIRLVAEMIESLPEDQRLCVLLYYREELNVTEIAKALDVSEGTVKSRLNYARQKIKTKVETLEKQGVKLYGMAPMPFLLWLLQGEAETMQIPTVLSAASGITGAAKATITTGGITAGKRATASGINALLHGTAAKVAAGGLAVTLAAGGVGIYQAEQKAAALREAEAERQAAAVAFQQQKEQAYEAFETMLAAGATDQGFQIRYYAYLDLDQNDIPELLAADNDGSADTMTSGMLYAYEDNAIRFIGQTGSYYYPIYLVNDGYLWGISRPGICSFMNQNERFDVWPEMWVDGVNQGPVIRYDGGDWISITEEKSQYYSACDESGPLHGERYFVQHKEIVRLERNPFFEEDMIYHETACFSVAIPQSWTGQYVTEIIDRFDYCSINIYERQSHESGWGGCVLSIYTASAEEDISYLPSGEVIGVSNALSQPLQVVAYCPTDVQFSPETMDAYMRLSDTVPEIIRARIIVK